MAKKTVKPEEPTSNVVLKHMQVKELKAAKKTVETTRKQRGIEITVVKHVPIPSYKHTLPNRRERRMEKQAIASRNRKNTAGRKVQFVDIILSEPTKFGRVKVPTGFIRKIVHHPVVAKVLMGTYAIRTQPKIPTQDGKS
jgi:hypothetical protein